jgi:hypothetical protein
MKNVPSLNTEGGGDDDNRDYGWWRTANLGECPITLEFFSTLGYPPFALYHPGKNTTTATIDEGTNRDGISAYFDGLALASYIVSRGVFQNPLTRIELTAEDCRRLDRYLEDHCYSSDAASTTTIFRGSRVISVAEAFALRNLVSVETATIRSDGRQSNNNNNNERDRERIQALQNTATAALAGLFVYGNDRHRTSTEITSHVPQLRNETSVLMNDWGFDLTRRVEDTTAEDTHGYTVIDDSEAIAFASQRHAYETVQEAFPPLTEVSSRKSRDCGEPSSASPNVSTDERLMERIRTLSVQDEEEQKRHARDLEKGREQLLRHALERREQRQKDRADRLARGAEHCASQKKDEAELERVRKEIEEWKDDQWEKLRLLSEHGQNNAKKERQKHNSVHSEDQNSDLHGDGDGNDRGGTEAVVDDGETMMSAATAEGKKKAKAVAKRKRAKERKKAKKTLEKEEAETIRLRKAKEAQRAASTLKCGACGTGILKPSLAFERFDQLFCTPKCARTAVKLGTG